MAVSDSPVRGSGDIHGCSSVALDRVTKVVSDSPVCDSAPIVCAEASDRAALVAAPAEMLARSCRQPFEGVRYSVYG